MNKLIALTAITLPLLTTVAFAQQVSTRDKEFLENAIQGDRAEVAIARFVRPKTQNRVARNFALRMIQDHTAHEAKVEQVAQQLGVTLPHATNTEGEQEIAKLRGKTDPALAQTYLADAVTDHRKVITMYTLEGRQSSNHEIRDMVQTTMPTLQAHLRLAEVGSTRVGQR